MIGKSVVEIQSLVGVMQRGVQGGAVSKKEKIKKYQQGELDKFCGLYSVINACDNLGVLDNAQETFDQLLKYISKKRLLEDYENGFPDFVVKDFLREINKPKRKIDFKQPYRGEDVASFIKKIDTFLSTNTSSSITQIVILSLDKPDDHWTVISKTTEKSLTLVDSSGLCAFKKSNCSIEDTGKKNTHIFLPDETFFISRAR